MTSLTCPSAASACGVLFSAWRPHEHAAGEGRLYAAVGRGLARLYLRRAAVSAGGRAGRQHQQRVHRALWPIVDKQRSPVKETYVYRRPPRPFKRLPWQHSAGWALVVQIRAFQGVVPPEIGALTRCAESMPRAGPPSACPDRMPRMHAKRSRHECVRRECAPCVHAPMSSVLICRASAPFVGQIGRFPKRRAACRVGTGRSPSRHLPSARGCIGDVGDGAHLVGGRRRPWLSLLQAMGSPQATGDLRRIRRVSKTNVQSLPCLIFRRRFGRRGALCKHMWCGGGRSQPAFAKYSRHPAAVGHQTHRVDIDSRALNNAVVHIATGYVSAC